MMQDIRLFALLAAAILAGCASVPGDISKPVEGPSIAEARGHPERYAGARVRWGGTISEVDNRENGTVITVVGRPLTRGGEPLRQRRSTGRFFAEIDRFLEPREYAAGRRITVTGRLTGIRQSKIDEYVYDYPVVRVQRLHLWREYARRDPYPWPYYRPYPYWYHPYWRRYPGYMHYPWHY